MATTKKPAAKAKATKAAPKAKAKAKAAPKAKAKAAPKAKAVWDKQTIHTQLVHSKTKKLESVILIPFGNTVLRQLTFKK